MKYYNKFLTISLLLLFGLSTQSVAQSISGRIVNQDDDPIPYANIFIKENQTGSISDGEGLYNITLITGGEYELVVSSIGYITKSVKVIVRDNDLKKDIRLNASDVMIDEIVVKASKKDSAYAIIQNVIDNKKAYLASVKSFKSDVYVKAKEVVETEVNEKKEAKKEKQKAKEAEKKKKNEAKKKDDKKDKKETETEENKNEDVDKLSIDGEAFDPFAEETKANQKLMSSLNLIEIELILNYQYPRKYKEERTAYKRSGSKHGLFVPLFGETDFNFYRNMVKLDGIAEAPVISPISTTSILSYKYKLMETRMENGQKVYKIKVMPRKTGNSTCSGFIYINDGIWNINRLDLKFHKGGLKFFDAFQLKINYTQVNDSLWIPSRQEFIYETKDGKFKTFKGNTVMLYSNYQDNYEFPPKFFSNEVVVTTKEAYERDSTYWETARPEPLSLEEKKVIELRDSIKAVIESEEYQDSLMREYNKVTLLEVFWDGVAWRNNDKKSHISVGSIPDLLDYSIVAGWRINPYFDYFRRLESGKMGRFDASASYGLKNQEIQGNFGTWIRYNPHRIGDLRFGAGRYFQSINNFDAFLNQLKISNYILNDAIYCNNRIEIFNGLYFRAGFTFNNRQPLDGFEEGTGLSNWIESVTEVPDIPVKFEGYQAFITNFRLSYTPKQKFMTEPTQKVILGSDFPTITLLYRKGWENVFSSDVNFDFWELRLRQDITFGAFGNSKYNARIGTFTNTKDLKFIDYQRFRQSDPILYAMPLYAFQALDTSLTTTKFFFEVHHIHHFNGAIMNMVPLLKKTNVRFVAGGGFLWVQENKLNHQEIFVGIERVFKLGARRRMRVGLYGVVADGNYMTPNTSYKISLDIIDTWKKDWSF